VCAGSAFRACFDSATAQTDCVSSSVGRKRRSRHSSLTRVRAGCSRAFVFSVIFTIYLPPIFLLGRGKFKGRLAPSTSGHELLHSHGHLDPSPPAFKQRPDTYFYYSRAVMMIPFNCSYRNKNESLACAQATAMRIDIAPHKRPRRKPPQHAPNPHLFHIPPHDNLRD
jgi:hypothetical protein